MVPLGTGLLQKERAKYFFPLEKILAVTILAVQFISLGNITHFISRFASFA